MTDVFDALADSARRDILELLRTTRNERAEMSVGELVDALGLTQPTVSKHLKVLREAGLVVVREEGQHRFYRVDEAPLRSLGAWAGGTPGSAVSGEPFVDLAEAGHAAGSLVRDFVDSLDDVRRTIFR